MNLIESLETIPDFRRREGRRYELTPMLIIIIMSIMSGRYRYREIALFAKANQTELFKILRLKRLKMPSHVTFRQIIQSIDFDKVNQAFSDWMVDYVKIEPGQWLAIDGKAIKSTVSEFSSSYQNFVSLVSVFTHNQGQVIKVSRLQNKHQSEIPVVEKLVAALHIKEAILTLDALHCKKNFKSDYKEQK